jgi:hypothetical protein
MARISSSAGRAKSARHERHLEKISAYELGKPRARMGNPNTGIPEFVVWSLYDIYAVAAGSAMGKLTLFTVPQGQVYNFNGVTAFTKGEQHVSLVQAGMLESSYTFIVRALSIYCQGNQGATTPYLNPADLLAFDGSLVKFRINKKEYFIGIPAWLPGGGGVVINGPASLTAPAGAVNATNGWQETDNVYAIPGGQYINPQEAFDTIVDPSTNAGGTPSALAAVLPGAGVPAGGLMAWFRMDGQLIRVAQ